MSKILVTGGAGFIGSNVADRYVELGHDVVIVDNLSTGFERNLNPKAKFYKADICDSKTMRQIFLKEKPKIVNHHAAQMDVRVSTRKPIFDARINIIGSLNILKNCIRTSVKKVIYSNTGGALYGEVKKEDLPINENYPINPICQYGISKHTVEHYLFLYSRNYGLKYTSLRYPNVFGDRQNPHGEAGVIAIFTGKMLSGKRPVIFGDGLQTRDYIYVKDIAEANVLALESEDSNAYNLGTGKETSVLDVFNTLKKELKFGEEPIFEKERLGEIMCFSLDASKIKADIGWTPKHSFKEGIKKTINYYKKD
jgi:UDP-glucose 4-epimerase